MRTAIDGRRTRRSVLAALAAVPFVSPGHASRKSSWKLCQSTDLTGPLAELGQAIRHGSAIAFDEINRQGGVHGRPIELATLDDTYDTAKAVANVETFLRDPDIFALYNCIGTPAVTAIRPLLAESGIPLFAPFTGASVARAPDVRNIFNVRASYAEEAQQLVKHLATVGIKRIGVAYQNNAFGREILAGAVAAGKNHDLPAPVIVSVETSSVDNEAAASQVADAPIEALLVALAGDTAVRFIKAIRARRTGLSLYAVSVVGPAATLKALGPAGVGLAISQVVPSPHATLPIAREYRAAWKASKTSMEPSHIGLEGYINARAFAAALRAAGASATPRSFVESTWSMKAQDLGGFQIAFTQPGRGASKFVELTMVSKDGRLVR